MLQHGASDGLSDKVSDHDVGLKSYMDGAKVHKESWVCSRTAYLEEKGDLLTYLIKYIEQPRIMGSKEMEFQEEFD